MIFLSRGSDSAGRAGMRWLEPGCFSAPCDFVPKTIHSIKGYLFTIEVFFVWEMSFASLKGLLVGFSHSSRD